MQHNSFNWSLIMLKQDLTGKRIIVTGASGGIGRCIVRDLTASGALVGLTARNRGPLEELSKEVAGNSGSTLVAPADVSDRQAVAEAVAMIRQAWGGIDIAVISAGTYTRSPVLESDPSVHTDQWQTSYLGTLNLFLEVIPEMVERGWGRLALVSSVDALKAMPRESAYASGKAAEATLASVLRQELHGTGVYISTVYPSRTDTPMTAGLHVPQISRKIPPEKISRALIRGIMKGKARLITPAIGPGILVTSELLSPRLADMFTRVFKLSGWTPSERE